VVEGRYATSAGVSTKELAQIMQYFGVAYAINLDGGGSSCMMIDKETKNVCSDGSQRAVADGLAIIKKN
jgi:exopolysaccharide biosynthesis protein